MESRMTKEQFLLENISHHFELSFRVGYRFKVSGILTIGDLVSKTAEDLLAIRGFGKKSLKEVRDELWDFGLKLKGE